jgi:pimeloyl-ACP methyl ester carboxylesterase
VVLGLLVEVRADRAAARAIEERDVAAAARRRPRPYASGVIAADVAGAGDPIVLVHGVGTSRVVWRHAVPLLAADRCVVAPDLPGFGASPPAGPGFALDAVADALADGLAAHVPAPYDVVGNSLGGAVAVVLAHRRPALVRRLVLVAPAGFAPHGPAVARAAGAVGERLVAVRRRVGAPLAGSALARRVALWGTVARPGELPAADARAMIDGSRGARRIGPAIAAVAVADLRPTLADLAVPWGIVWGDRDRVVPIATLPMLRDVDSHAPVEVLPGVGHVPHMERPAVFAAALERLLDRLPAVTAS